MKTLQEKILDGLLMVALFFLVISWRPHAHSDLSNGAYAVLLVAILITAVSGIVIEVKRLKNDVRR